MSKVNETKSQNSKNDELTKDKKSETMSEVKDNKSENSNSTRKSDRSKKSSKTGTSKKSKLSGIDEEDEDKILDSMDVLGDQVFLNAPRKNCHELAPAVERLLFNPNEKQSKHIHLFKSILSRYRDKNVDKTINHLLNFDKSETVRPEGEVSKALYFNIEKQRRYNKYGDILRNYDHKYLEEQEKKLAVSLLGDKYKNKRAPDESEAIRKAAVPVFDHELPVKIQPIKSDLWKVGMKEVYNAPVGFSRDPGSILNSEGNEIYYPYDGEWKDGKMEGKGVYLFHDKTTYEGFFKENRHHGVGDANYSIGSRYHGEWKKGKFDGEGVLECAGGTVYEGSWKNGKREGRGKLSLPGGLTYVGDWVNGVPHGKGKMTSIHTGYSYEGSFNEGSIYGSGTLFTPPPQSERIVRYWPSITGGLTLTGAVRLLIKERKDFVKTTHHNRELMMSSYRQLKLQDYVANVRTTLHEGRAKEKADKIAARIKEIKEAKEKMREAKIRSLLGTEDEEIQSKQSSSDSDDNEDDGTNVTPNDTASV